MSSLRQYEENVRDLINRPGEMRERERTVEVPESFGEALASIPAGELMHLAVRLESVHEGILASVSADTTMHAECGRCLEKFTAPFEVEFQELFAYTPTEADEQRVHGDHVNLEPPLRDAVVMALPFQPVCREDCPGLNPETGEPSSTQGEAEARVVDPRWAKLQGLLPDTTVPQEQAE